VINRRDDRLGRRPHCFPLAREEQRKPAPRMYLTGSSISEEQQFEKLRREVGEKLFLTVYERARIFNMSIPELDGLDLLLKAQATFP
jgi:hypothetical protein